MPAKNGTIDRVKGKPPTPRERQLAALQRRYARLALRLANPGLLLQGTITEVRPRRAAAGAKTKTYGPYYQWTQKQNGRTVTINLSATQHAPFSCAIANQRRLDNTLATLRDLSRQILDLTTEGVPKRIR